MPIEFYDPTSLLKIGIAIGPVLRIDSHTVNGARGRFSRLCVQVNLDKPLVRNVYIGKLAQSVQYEGINSLCFSCGRLDTRKRHARLTRELIKEKEKEQDPCTSSNIVGGLQHGRNKMEGMWEEYGAWMVVTKCKPPSKARAKPPI